MHLQKSMEEKVNIEIEANQVKHKSKSLVTYRHGSAFSHNVWGDEPMTLQIRDSRAWFVHRDKSERLHIGLGQYSTTNW
jgi:hypothetical protein